MAKLSSPCSEGCAPEIYCCFAGSVLLNVRFIDILLVDRL